MTLFPVAHANAIAFLKIVFNFILSLNPDWVVPFFHKDVESSVFMSPRSRPNSPILTSLYDCEKHRSSPSKGMVYHETGEIKGPYIMHQNKGIVALLGIFSLQRIEFSKDSFCHYATY